MRISDLSSDVCSSDLEQCEHLAFDAVTVVGRWPMLAGAGLGEAYYCPSGGLLFAEAIVAALTVHLRDRGVTFVTNAAVRGVDAAAGAVTLADGTRLGADRVLRSEEHTSELQSLMRISYAVFCLKKKKNTLIKRTLHIQ